MRAAALLAILLLTGCLGGGAPRTVPSVSAPAADPTPAISPTETVKIPLHLEGGYPNAVYTCHDSIGCQGKETGPYKTEILIANVTGNITSLELTMTWSATGPMMETLGVAAMIMYPESCKDCKSIEFTEAKGPSPLKLEYTATPLAIAPPTVLHIYFYAFNEASEPIAIEADTETSVLVEGSATLLRLARRPNLYRRSANPRPRWRIPEPSSRPSR